MPDGPKYTRDQANALLPEIRERLEQLQSAYRVLAELTDRLKQASQSNGRQGAGREMERAAAEVADALGWFEQRGIIVRDIAQGLIDFPAVRDGEDILLCWKAPEPAVDFWHPPEAGFAGRQPL